MAEKLVYFLYLIISILFYTYAPAGYSNLYCFSIFVCFSLAVFYSFYRNFVRFGYFFCFGNIFLLIFGLTSFLHSSFFMENEGMFSAYRYSYNYFIVNESVALAQLGVSFYLLGSSFVTSRFNLRPSFVQVIRPSARYFKIYSYVSITVAIFWMFFVFLVFERDSAYVIIYPKLTLLLSSFIIFNFILSIFNYSSIRTSLSFVDFIKSNSLTVLSVVIFIIPFLYLGSRTIPSSIVVICLALINRYIYRIRITQLVFFLAAGFFAMAVISMSRISEFNFSNTDPISAIKYSYELVMSSDDLIGFLLQDFIVNARNLYDGVNYLENNPPLMGISYLFSFLGFIPFLPTLVLDFFGLTQLDINSSLIMTDLNNANFGLGTHLVGDIYMNGGLFLVALIMFFLGYITSKSEFHNSSIMVITSVSLYSMVFMFSRVSPFAWLELFFMLFFHLILFRHFNS